jgi:hypothetical protein
MRRASVAAAAVGSAVIRLPVLGVWQLAETGHFWRRTGAAKPTDDPLLPVESHHQTIAMAVRFTMRSRAERFDRTAAPADALAAGLAPPRPR